MTDSSDKSWVKSQQHTPPSKTSVYIRETLIGLAVAVVILNLGAAMGLLAGRGAWLGMLSAGVIALIAAIFSGTRIQNSSPTAPMAALMAVIVAFSVGKLPGSHPAVAPHHFVNAILLGSGLLLWLGSVLGLGRYVHLVPNLVVSGFMSGIALLIWKLEVKKIWGWLSQDVTENLGQNQAGLTNAGLVILTVVLSFMLPKLCKKLLGEHGTLLPGTLLALLLVTVFVQIFGLPATLLTTDVANTSQVLSLEWLHAQWPSSLTWGAFFESLPYMAELTILCALDTLITALIIARILNEPVRYRRDLGAQGIASTVTGLFGGVPGAQSTAPSVLLLKEKAQTRWAAISTGIFALLIALVVAPALSYVPIAVFTGILIKVGYNVLDKKPFIAFWHSAKNQQAYWQIGLLIGTMLVTAFYNIIFAVIAFTIAYHLLNKVVLKEQPVPDVA